MTCDSTDPECVYGCLRAEVTCFYSKYFNKRINDNSLTFSNFIKAVHVTSIVPAVVMVARIQFANAR